jgi:hypothetical protein
MSGIICIKPIEQKSPLVIKLFRYTTCANHRPSKKYYKKNTCDDDEKYANACQEVVVCKDELFEIKCKELFTKPKEELCDKNNGYEEYYEENYENDPYTDELEKYCDQLSGYLDNKTEKKPVKTKRSNCTNGHGDRRECCKPSPDSECEYNQSGNMNYCTVSSNDSSYTMCFDDDVPICLSSVFRKNQRYTFAIYISRKITLNEVINAFCDEIANVSVRIKDLFNPNCFADLVLHKTINEGMFCLMGSVVPTCDICQPVAYVSGIIAEKLCACPSDQILETCAFLTVNSIGC